MKIFTHRSTPSLIPALAVFLAASGLTAQDVSKAPVSKMIQDTFVHRDPTKAATWAGALAPLLGEGLARYDAFAAARKADIHAGAQIPWKAWLSELSASEKKTLKVWALTRLVEAGSYDKFQDLTEAMVQHVRGETQGKSGYYQSVVEKNLPGVFGASAPTFLISDASPFWASLDRTIREDPERAVGGGLYTVWCYNTRPNQRELIEEIARHIQSPLTIKNPKADPWNDPRFWIVLDWAIVWGEQKDFDRLGQLIPQGPARSEFQKRTQRLLANSLFFSCKPPSTLDDRKLDAESQQHPGADLGLDLPGMVDFRQVKVKHQPATLAYPVEAKSRALMGTNVVMIKIDPAGIPCQARPAPGPWLAFFSPASLDFVKDWRFDPQKENGVPQDSRFLLNIIYRLVD